MFALCDVNAFYASCETVFRPDLWGKPVVVLSNNDGCVIARNAEAKALGVKMGDPWFKQKDLFRRCGVVCFSSNYELYADMSNRVMSTLEELSPRVEIYSIDEAFCDLTGVRNCRDLTDFGREIRATVLQRTHLTVGVGIKTVLDLADTDIRFIRKHFNVVLERTVRELRGEPCLQLEEFAPTKQEIICSRSFGERITDYPSMRQAICSYAARAAEKLRSEHQYCRFISTFIKTSPFALNEPYYGNSASVKLLTPTQDSRDIINAATRSLDAIWQAGHRYQKAGVMLGDFFSQGVAQLNLFDDNAPRPGSEQLMTVMDTLNAKEGRGTLYFAGQGIQQQWQMKRAMLSPRYTTRSSDLLRVK
ncbi:translesion error-prone DNA polymerase V subunit UmuC [Escherichia coli]|uniref:translesion error-prone DNA polymerase V subunit UmuC n=1 Tax=Escherichia coli TaxID=562 RepID=UPI0031B62393